jgi:hypothetical protein
MGVVCKDDQLILLPFIAKEMETLLDVGDNDSVPHCVDASDEVW